MKRQYKHTLQQSLGLKDASQQIGHVFLQFIQEDNCWGTFTPNAAAYKTQHIPVPALPNFLLQLVSERAENNSWEKNNPTQGGYFSKLRSCSLQILLTTGLGIFHSTFGHREKRLRWVFRRQGRWPKKEEYRSQGRKYQIITHICLFMTFESSSVCVLPCYRKSSTYKHNSALCC